MLSSRSMIVDTGPKRRSAESVEIPDLVAHHRIMRVDDVAHVVLVTREMELHDAIGGHAVDELDARRSRD